MSSPFRSIVSLWLGAFEDEQGAAKRGGHRTAFPGPCSDALTNAGPGGCRGRRLGVFDRQMVPYIVGALLGVWSIARGVAIGTHRLGTSLAYIGLGAALFALDAWIIRDKSRRL